MPLPAALLAILLSVPARAGEDKTPPDVVSSRTGIKFNQGAVEGGVKGVAVAAAAPSWSEGLVNKSYDDAAPAAKKGADLSVPIRVWVVKGAKVAEANFSVYVRWMNSLYNNEKNPPNCGIRFKFVGPVQEIDLPKEYHDLVDFVRDHPKDEAYHGSSERLSKGEVKLFELMGQTQSGAVNAVFIPGLGGGRGYTYQDKLLPGPVGKMKAEELPGKKTAEEVVKAYKATILLSDTRAMGTLAHEMGHALLNEGHTQACDAEEKKADPAGCAELEKNLMLADGKYGDRLLESQCKTMARRLRKGKLDR